LTGKDGAPCIYLNYTGIVSPEDKGGSFPSHILYTFPSFFSLFLALTLASVLRFYLSLSAIELKAEELI